MQPKYTVIKSSIAPSNLYIYVPNWPITIEEALRLLETVSVKNRLFFSVVLYKFDNEGMYAPLELHPSI